MKISPRPYLTSDLDGTGGRIKSRPEDFVVEEIPAYEPVGQGSHVYLWVEKRDAAAGWFLSELSRALGVNKRDMGTAGNKDRHAVTRQWVSVPVDQLAVEDIQELVGPVNDNMTILKATRHGNKLKTGHLRGNRFRVVIRELELPPEQALERAEAIQARLEAQGVPNYYGLQRFGREGSTLALGLGLMRGEPDAVQKARRDRFLKRLAVSAVQSELFNRVLGRRMERELLHVVLEGDVLQKTDTGGMFVVEPDGVQEAQQRLEAREVVPTGPMPGPKMKAPAGEAARFESEIYAEAGVDVADFEVFGKLAQGTRRALLIKAEELKVSLCHGEDREEGKEELGAGLVWEFSLPPGSYATVVLREVIKAALPDDE